KVPLPPYIHRDTIEEDTRRYQTIYSRSDGAVASSTAGLHFTGDTLESLEKSGIKLGYVTLHVGAGTFLPIKGKNAVDHDMHSEQIILSGSIIDELITHQGPVIAGGTTVMRALESVYWYGVKILSGSDEFNIGKLDPYDHDPKTLPPVKESYIAVREKFSGLNTDTITGETSIYILPGYNFKTCSGLLTNFHLPGSTLIMLVAAFAGNDWKRIYTEAIIKDYRFLSYGDTSLILPDPD
ncbi:MAG TPA: S-adenosylmethionine:tRNA ribosyltransferase-isomerase, partial [Cyclobacteriaceae bacterium]|nr:S-adenosylmethionine:tRNA ribosyltransferase-isomerase [Cyclobacteriaceae bacterium]